MLSVVSQTSGQSDKLFAEDEGRVTPDVRPPIDLSSLTPAERARVRKEERQRVERERQERVSARSESTRYCTR